MAKEIERKFLVIGEDWRTDNGIFLRQGFIHNEVESTVRVRATGERAYLTIKSAMTGITRTEFEYEIPIDDANQMLNELCQQPLIEKIRHKIQMDGFTWEIDEFLGVNAGLVVAEIELEGEDQKFPKPNWLGEEVSDDARYLNANLVKNPYSKWDAVF